MCAKVMPVSTYHAFGGGDLDMSYPCQGRILLKILYIETFDIKIQSYCGQALKAVISSVDTAMRDERVCGLDASESGSNACIAIVSGSQLLVASAGALHPRISTAGDRGALCRSPSFDPLCV